MLLQDLLDAVFNVKQIPGWLSAVITIVFVWSNVLTSLVVTDLGEVLHMIGGTAASFMIFFLPGLLLMNGAIIKHTYSCTSLSALVRGAVRAAVVCYQTGTQPVFKANDRLLGQPLNASAINWIGCSHLAVECVSTTTCLVCMHITVTNAYCTGNAQPQELPKQLQQESHTATHASDRCCAA